MNRVLFRGGYEKTDCFPAIKFIPQKINFQGDSNQFFFDKREPDSYEDTIRRQTMLAHLYVACSVPASLCVFSRISKSCIGGNSDLCFLVH